MAKNNIDYSQYMDAPQKEDKIDYSKYGGIAKPADTGTDNKEAARKQFIDLATNDIFSRPGTRLTQDALSLAGNTLSTIGSGALSTAGELATDPLRAARNVAAGISGIPSNVANTALNLPSYLAHLESNKLSNKIKEYTPQIPTEKIENFVGGDNPTQQDINIRKLAELTPITFPLGKAAGKATADSFSSGNPFQKAHVATLEKAISDKSMNLEDIANEHQSQLEAQKSAQEQSEIETGKAKPSTMQFNVSKLQNDINEKQNNLNDLNNQLEAHKNTPVLSPVDVESHENNVQNAKSMLDESENQKENLSDLKDKAKEALGKSEENIGDHLNVGEAHHIEVGRYLKDEIGKIEKEGSSKFKEVKRDLKDSNFQMPNMDQYKTSLEDDLSKFKKGSVPIDVNELMGKGKFKLDNPEFADLMDKAPTPKDSNASDFITKYQDYRDHRYDMIQRLKDDITSSERRNIIDALKSSENMTSTIESTLNNGLGPFKDKWDEANAIYSKKIYPLRANSVAKKVNKNSKMSNSNMVEQLAGDEAGHEILGDLVNKNPEILKHIMGQQFGKKSFFDKGTLKQQYIDKMPALKELIDKKQDAALAVNKADQLISDHKEMHADIKSNYDQAVQNRDNALSESKNVEKQNKAREENINSVKDQIKAHQDDIADQNKRIDRLNKHITNLQNESSKSKMTGDKFKDTQKELADLKSQLKDAEKSLNDSKGKLFKAATRGYRVARGAVRLISKIGI